jgi:hypothetical protein
MSRKAVTVATPALALRRAEAAASLGLSVEAFDAYARPHLPCVRCGSVTTYPVAGLQAWLERESRSPAHDLDRPRRTA